MKKVIVINSKARQNYQTTKSGSFRINLTSPLSTTQSPMTVELVGVCIPNGFFNIDSSNNSFSIDMQGDQVYSFTLASGFYTLMTLCSSIQTAINTAVGYGSFTVVYSSSTESITITSGDGDNFKCVNSELSKLIGFYNVASQSYEVYQTSNGSIQFMTQPMFLYLDISQYSKSICDSYGEVISTFLIPMKGNSPASIDMESITYIPYSDLQMLNQPIQISDPRGSFLDIRLLDKNKNIVNMSADWHFVLRAQ
jgi:hypothetical protein